VPVEVRSEAASSMFKDKYWFGHSR